MNTGFNPERDRRGRPPYDALTVYLYVEAGRRLTGQTVKGFCDSAKFVVVQGGGGGRSGHYDRKPRILTGEALRRRYNAVRKPVESAGLVVSDHHRGDAQMLLQDELERLILEEMARQAS